MKNIKILCLIIILFITFTTKLITAQDNKDKKELPECATFELPEIEYSNSTDMYRLDWCYRLAGECGKIAADAFCQSYGFTSAGSLPDHPIVVENSPTLIIGDNIICNKPSCYGFSYIECCD